jgi:hypothetical protein
VSIQKIETMKTADDQNDEIAAQVDREIPAPPHGFASCDERDEHRRKQDARFIELCLETMMDAKMKLDQA